MQAPSKYPAVLGLDRKDAVISNEYNVYYDMFLIPKRDVAVFEVGVGLSHEATDGWTSVDFNSGNSSILCPRLELEIMSARPVLE
jgi:hypothetical protein